MNVDWVRRWTTTAGLEALVLDCRGMHLCGYVRVPPGHELFGKSYNEHVPGLSAAWEKAKQGTIGKRGILSLVCIREEGGARPEWVFDVHGSLTFAGSCDGTDWWFGFDCGHADDTRARCDAEYVSGECESLAAQIVAACGVA